MPRTTQLTLALERLSTLREQIEGLPSSTQGGSPTRTWNALQQEEPPTFVSARRTMKSELGL